MSKITLEDCAQEYDRRAGDSASGVTVNDYPGANARQIETSGLSVWRLALAKQAEAMK